MAEMKNEKTKKSDEDIKFSREELISDDLREADFAREKRNKPIPAQLLDQAGGDPNKVLGWPFPEDRLPAVMPADKEADHDYKQESYDKVDDEARDKELAGQPGDVARAEVNKVIAKTIEEGGDLNEVQAPPSENAQLAADGKGAPSAKLPTAGMPVRTVAVPAAPAPKTAAKSDSK